MERGKGKMLRRKKKRKIFLSLRFLYRAQTGVYKKIHVWPGEGNQTFQAGREVAEAAYLKWA